MDDRSARAAAARTGSPYLNTAQAAHYLGLSQRTLERMRTLTELKQLHPPAKVEYVEKQPTLEDIFFAVVGDGGTRGASGADE